jgi:hypothetical protein
VPTFEAQCWHPVRARATESTLILRMGCSTSKGIDTKEKQNLYRAFERANKAQRNKMSLVEFLDLVGEQRTAFTGALYFAHSI